MLFLKTLFGFAASTSALTVLMVLLGQVALGALHLGGWAAQTNFTGSHQRN